MTSFRRALIRAETRAASFGRPTPEGLINSRRTEHWPAPIGGILAATQGGHISVTLLTIVHSVDGQRFGILT